MLELLALAHKRTKNLSSERPERAEARAHHTLTHPTRVPPRVVRVESERGLQTKVSTAVSRCLAWKHVRQVPVQLVYLIYDAYAARTVESSPRHARPRWRCTLGFSCAHAPRQSPTGQTAPRPSGYRAKHMSTVRKGPIVKAIDLCSHSSCWLSFLERRYGQSAATVSSSQLNPRRPLLLTCQGKLGCVCEQLLPSAATGAGAGGGRYMRSMAVQAWRCAGEHTSLSAPPSSPDAPDNNIRACVSNSCSARIF